MILSISGVTDRGLQSFSLLTPVEKDIFVLNDLDLYYEMEGGFEDHVLGDHGPELSWLDDTLKRIGDSKSGAIIRVLRAMPAQQRDEMHQMCSQYYELREKTRSLLECHLRLQVAEQRD